MPIRTVFDDENGHTLQLYINTKGALYLEISQPEHEMYTSYITLNKEDVGELIEQLLILQQSMQ
jgi:hypothetical protein